jgi:polyisoprenoid-binding protein YceI
MLALLADGTLAGKWALDPDVSSIRFKSRSVFGLVPVSGVFREVSGGGTISPDGEVSGAITVAAGSVDTKHAKRDKHLRSADFFDSDGSPDITFTTDGVRPSGEGVTVTGTLTIRGRTRPLSFDAAVAVHGGAEIWLDGSVRVNRADFGITWNPLGMVSMDNAITIHAVFTRR